MSLSELIENYLLPMKTMEPEHKVRELLIYGLVWIFHGFGLE